MALMASKGLIGPMPDVALFADTQCEPSSVYAWLDYLEPLLSFPVHRVTAGNLADSISGHTSKSGTRYVRIPIPAHITNKDGSHGILGRQCTDRFKLRPLARGAKKLFGVRRAKRELRVRFWIGISTDEAHRMKPSREVFAENRWPLIELGMSRVDCLKWMSKNGYPEPPKSACTFCPFHSDAEWRKLKAGPKEEWDNVISIEKTIQRLCRDVKAVRGEPFLHYSRKPIDEIEFTASPKTHNEIDLFGNECEGMCGV